MQISRQGIPWDLDGEPDYSSPEALVASANKCLKPKHQVRLAEVELWNPEGRFKARVRCIDNFYNISCWIYA